MSPPTLRKMRRRRFPANCSSAVNVAGLTLYNFFTGVVCISPAIVQGVPPILCFTDSWSGTLASSFRLGDLC